MSVSALDVIKNRILDILPGPLARELYLVRHKEVLFRKEMLNGKAFEVSIPRTMLSSYSKGHEEGVAKWLQQHARPGEVFFDVGACYGYFSALVSALHPDSAVHAFEPFWGHSLFLKMNAGNHPGNAWRVTEKWVGERTSGNRISLDDYCRHQGVYPTLLKMDVDGAELSALRGCKNIIESGKTRFLIELHPGSLKGENLSFDDFMNSFFGKYSIMALPSVHKGNTSWIENMTGIRRAVEQPEGDVYLWLSRGQ